MSKSCSELKASVKQFKPVPVTIYGFDEQVLVHQFAWGRVDDILAIDGKGSLAKIVFVFLNGVEYLDDPSKITDQDISELMSVFTFKQINDIHEQGLIANGYGNLAARIAEKNSERTLA